MIENINSFLYLVSQVFIPTLLVVILVGLLFYLLGRKSAGKRSSPPNESHINADSHKKLLEQLAASENARRKLAIELQEKSHLDRDTLATLESKLSKLQNELAQTERLLDEQRNRPDPKEQARPNSLWRVLSPSHAKEAHDLLADLATTRQDLEEQRNKADSLQHRISDALSALSNDLE